jgi:hypothetical protein
MMTNHFDALSIINIMMITMMIEIDVGHMCALTKANTANHFQFYDIESRYISEMIDFELFMLEIK